VRISRALSDAVRFSRVNHLANRRQSCISHYSISFSQVLRQSQSLPDNDLRLPGLVRDLLIGHFSVTDPAPAGTSPWEIFQPDHASGPGGNVNGFGTRTVVRSPAASRRGGQPCRRRAGVRLRRRALAAGGPSVATAQKIRELQQLAALLAGRPSAMSYLEDASANAKRTSGRAQCSTQG
jgi:hypothetical protein